MRKQLQSPLPPLTDMQKWGVFLALVPLCPVISMLCLYFGYDRGGMDDFIIGYVMAFFALPYSFFHSLTFGPWYTGEAGMGVLTLFWLPFFVLHLTFFFTRSSWSLGLLVFMWLVAAPRWHYYALVFMRM